MAPKEHKIHMFITKRHFTPTLHILAGCAIGMLFLFALVLRISLYHVETSDYTVFVSQWYDFIQTHGGFAALKYNFSNYRTFAYVNYLPMKKCSSHKDQYTPSKTAPDQRGYFLDPAAGSSAFSRSVHDVRVVQLQAIRVSDQTIGKKQR